MRVLYLYGVGFLLEAVIFIFVFAAAAVVVLVYGFVVGFLVVDFLDEFLVRREWEGVMGVI